MERMLQNFVFELAGVISGTLLVVIFIAFLSIPHHLRDSSGNVPTPATASPWHPT